MNRKEKRQSKLQQIREYRASGLSLKEWSDQNGEKYSTMRYWNKVERDSRVKGQTQSATKGKEKPSWIQLDPLDESDKVLNSTHLKAEKTL